MFMILALNTLTLTTVYVESVLLMSFICLIRTSIFGALFDSATALKPVKTKVDVAENLSIERTPLRGPFHKTLRNS